MGTYQMFGWAGQPAGGIFTKPAQMPGPPSWLAAYIKVPDSKKTAASVKKQGGKVINGPMEVPGGDWIAQGMDLQRRGVCRSLGEVRRGEPTPPPRRSRQR